MARKLSKIVTKKKENLIIQPRKIRIHPKSLIRKKIITEEKNPFVVERSAIQRDTLKILSTKESLEGKYCNIAVIKHTTREFIIDFIFNVEEHTSLVSRVITNPKHAKEIYEVLGINIKQYEDNYGKI